MLSKIDKKYYIIDLGKYKLIRIMPQKNKANGRWYCIITLNFLVLKWFYYRSLIECYFKEMLKGF